MRSYSDSSWKKRFSKWNFIPPAGACCFVALDAHLSDAFLVKSNNLSSWRKKLLFICIWYKFNCLEKKEYERATYCMIPFL